MLLNLGQKMHVTRDSPNVIVPVIAAGISVIPGAAWAWSAYIQVSAGLAFPFLLTQLHMATLAGGTYTADTPAAGAPALFHHEIATGAAGAEVPLATVIDAQNSYTSIAGIVDDVVSVTSLASTIHDIAIGPVIIPSGIRIAVRSTKDLAYVAYTRFYLSGYDLTALPNFVKVPGVDDLYEVGSRPLTTAPLVVLGSTLVTPVAHAYAEVIAAIADDTLIVGMATHQTVGQVGANVQFDVSLGAAGSEVMQARAGFPVSAYVSAGFIRFPYPFIAHKGERLAVRGWVAGVGRTYPVILYGIRLS